MGFLDSIKKGFSGQPEEVREEDYVHVDAISPEGQSKIHVRSFTLNEYEDIKEVLDVLRAGRTVVLMNIQPLRERDVVDLKRAVNKLKKTADACNGDVAGFGDDCIVATPASAAIWRGGSGTNSDVYE